MTTEQQGERQLPLLTSDDVATRLKVRRPFVWKLVRLGALPAVRIGKELRFDPADVEEFIARRKTPRPRSMR